MARIYRPNPVRIPPPAQRPIGTDYQTRAHWAKHWLWSGGAGETPFWVVLPSTLMLQPGELSSPQAYQVGDPNDPLDSLVVSAISNNQAVVPDANIVIVQPDAAGSGTFTVQATATEGVAEIEFTVKDPAGNSSVRRTTVTVEGLTAPVWDVDPSGTYQVYPGNLIGPLNYRVSDERTAPGDIVVTAQSTSDPAIVPLANVTITGPDAAGNGTIQLQTLAAVGSTDVVIRATDSDALFTDITITAQGVNANPTWAVEPGDPAPTNPGVATVPEPYTVSDDQADLSALTVAFQASDNLAVIGSGSDLTIVQPNASGNGTVAFTPLAAGSANVTLRVTDEFGGTADTVVNVIGNAAPTWTLEPGDPASVEVGQTTTPENYTVSDDLTVASSLVVSFVSSSDPAVIADASDVTITGPDGSGNGTVAFTPIGEGSTNVTLRVTDELGLSADTVVLVTATAVPTFPPSFVGDYPFRVSLKTSGQYADSYQVADPDDPLDSLVVSGLTTDALVGSPVITAQPDAGGNGTYRIDAGGTEGTADITLRVTDPDTQSADQDIELVTNDTLLFKDTFTAANGTDLADHWPDFDLANLGWEILNGTWEVQTNRGQPTGVTPPEPTWLSLFDTSLADVMQEAQLGNLAATSGTAAFIVFRANFTTFWTYCFAEVIQDVAGESQLRLGYFDGTLNYVETYTDGTLWTDPVIRVEGDADRIQVYRDGTLAISRVLNYNQTATYHGARLLVNSQWMDLEECKPCEEVPPVWTTEPVNQTGDISTSLSTQNLQVFDLNETPDLLTVSVQGNTNPAVAAAVNITQPDAGGACTVQVDLGATAGTSTITLRVTDSTVQFADTSFTVTAEDTAPTVDTPEDIARKELGLFADYHESIQSVGVNDG